jgi:hypothetical protein
LAAAEGMRASAPKRLAPAAAACVMLVPRAGGHKSCYIKDFACGWTPLTRDHYAFPKVSSPVLNSDLIKIQTAPILQA